MLVARLKITLDDVEPKVLRRVEVPLAIRLDRLHLTIQAAMGWSNSHLYEISAGGVGWGIPDPNWPGGPLDARKTKLVEVLEDTGLKTLHYLYDFGDSWEHTIKIERLSDPEAGSLYPRLIEAIGRCPPEDVGGAPGYAELLDATADSQHERHAEISEWLPDNFNPNAVNIAMLEADVAALAKSWSRKPPSKRPKSA
jgi:hypothetical protein